MYVILYILQFFPSISFNLLSAEIFPWPLLLGIYHVLNSGKINKWIIIIIFLILSHLVFFSLIRQQEIKLESVRVLMAYINGPILYWLILSKYNVYVHIRKLVNPIFSILICLGIMQYTNLFSALTPLIQLLVERGMFEQLGGGRGVTLMSTEPARAGVELIFIYTFISSYIGDINHRRVYDVLFFLYLIVFIKAFTCFCFFGLVLFIRYPKFIVSIIFVLLVTSLSLTIEGAGRTMSLLNQLLNSRDLQSMINILISQSGFRFISVYSAYMFLSENINGGMVGHWANTSLEAIKASGYTTNEITYFKYHFEDQFVGVRPTSYFANLVLDLGIFAWVLLYFIFRVKEDMFIVPRELLILFFFSFFFLGTVGNPIPWLVLGLSIKKIRSEKEVART